MQFLKKKAAAAVALLLAMAFVFSSVGTVDAKAAELPKLNDSTILGIAANFGVFAETFKTEGHTQNPFAAKNLELCDAINNPNNSNIKVSYLQNSLKTTQDEIKIDAEYLVVGNNVSYKRYEENGRKSNNQWSINTTNRSWVKTSPSNNTQGIRNLVTNDSYINIDSELASLRNLSAKLAKEDANTVYNKSDINKQFIDCKNTVNVVKVNARDFYQNDGDLSFLNLGKDAVVIIDVNMAGYNNNTFTINKRSKFGTNVNNAQQVQAFPGGYTQIIWNFSGYTGTVKTNCQSTGVILAPDAKVEVGNWEGIVIAKEVTVKGGELHFRPFNYEEPEPEVTPAKFIVESVDGTCCPSVGIPGGEYTLWKEVNGAYKKQKDTAQTPKPVVLEDGTVTYICMWDITEEGKYYVKETKTPDSITEEHISYVQTPIKGRFTATKNENNEITIKLNPGNEVNGYAQKDVTISGKMVFDGVKFSGIKGYKMRNYRNILNASATYKNYTKLVKGNCLFEIYRADENLNLIDTFPYKVAGVDSESYAWIDIEEPGYYAIQQVYAPEGFEIEDGLHFVAVYFTPAGQILPFEIDDLNFASEVKGAFGTAKQLKKITKRAGSFVAAYATDETFISRTDGWVLSNCVKIEKAE